MREIEIQLFGALREAEPGARIAFETDAATVAQLRTELLARVAAWPDAARALLPRSAFANSTSVLRDAEALPDDGRLALLPPVSGG
ncbi:MoaD/ThiS family protein [Cognatilysobacter segetis]|uniref:MoaD/ThiS family protein n=1 Tax=Cognatilysobacter segetis TaxID=2492394 RepID=UPI00105BBE34|nr:MoaD/ThiS family protein [Lysobacter segetis]